MKNPPLRRQEKTLNHTKSMAIRATKEETLVGDASPRHFEEPGFPILRAISLEKTSESKPRQVMQNVELASSASAVKTVPATSVATSGAKK